MTAAVHMLGASLKMLYRSPQMVRLSLASPIVLIALLALMTRLRFEVDGRAIDFFDFSAVGVVLYQVAFVAQYGMVGGAMSYKVQGVLKRIAVTPLSPAVFISTQALARVVAAVVQTVVVLLAAFVLGADIQLGLQLVWVVPLAAGLALMALTVAFVIAGATDNPDAANTLNMIVTVPVFAIGGTFFPADAAPAAIQDVASYAIPYVPIFEMLRGVASEGQGIAHFGGEMLTAGGWLVALFLLAARLYRFEEA